MTPAMDSHRPANAPHGPTMRKVIRPLSQQFNEVILFLDDVERIIAFMAEISPVQIRTDEYVFDSIDEPTYRLYPGGKALAAYLLLRELPVTGEALDEHDLQLGDGVQQDGAERVLAGLQPRPYLLPLAP